ncbi:rhodanese-like domain-containing protein [Candidatus Babeliales bacterium]|nr:rhodanese-like domain-containing protein [Candidatus Babeliales bacterium]
MISKKYDILTTKHSSLLGCSLIMFGVTMLAGCFNFWKKSEVATEVPKLVVINVLDASYYDDCHIKGSINIPFEQFEETVKTLPKQNKYVVYCSNYACTAAPFAVKVMLNSGFENVRLLPGGIVEWYQKQLPIEGKAELQYLQEDDQPMGDESEDVPVVTAEQLAQELQQEQQ